MIEHDECQAIGEIIQKVMSIISRNTETFHEHLGELSTSAKLQLAALEDLTTQVNGHMTTKISNITNVIITQDVNIDDLSHQLNQQSDAVSSTLDVANQLRTTTLRLDDIANESRLLSVNAKIEAVHLGAESRSIQVIADNIRDLSKSLNYCASGLEEIMISFSETVPKLEKQMYTAQTNLGIIKGDQVKISALIGDSQAYIAHELSLTVSDTKKRLESTISNIHQALSTMHTYDEVIQMLNAVLIRLGTGQEDPSIGTPNRLTKGKPELEKEELDDIVFF